MTTYAFFLALIPSTAWLIFWWTLTRKKESFWIIALCLNGGILVSILLWFIQPYFINIGKIIILSAVIEEFLKCSIFILIIERYFKKFDRIIDGIIYGISVALGFAFIENLLYFHEALVPDGFTISFWGIFTIRLLLTTFAHSVFTGIFGYTYASAYLQKNLLNKTSWKNILLDILRLRIIFEQILNKKKTPYSGLQLIIEGFLVAVYCHLLFNIIALANIGGHALNFLLPSLIFIIGWGLNKKIKPIQIKRLIHHRLSPLNWFLKNWTRQ